MIKVILCDDHAVVRRGIRDTISEATDIQVVGEAGSYPELRELMRKVECDVLVLDLNMPRMDGLEATRQIRALASPLGNIPIVAVTANAAPDEVEACMSAGMTAFVAKPIRAAELLEVLSAALSAADAVRPG